MPSPSDPSIPAYWTRAKRALAERDPVMRDIIRSCRAPGLRVRGAPFETLARSIVGQQISVKAAASVWARFVGVVGQVEPGPVARADLDSLCAAGLSRRKAEYITDLARRFEVRLVDPSCWAERDDEAIIAELVEVRGIGRWTAEMLLMFSLARPDVLPVADLGLQRAVSLHYRRGRAVSAKTIQRIAEVWQPWRSVATWYLWRSLEPVPVEY